MTIGPIHFIFIAFLANCEKKVFQSEDSTSENLEIILSKAIEKYFL